jgi:hypothetical protein
VSLVRALAKRGEHGEARRLLVEAIVRHDGNIVAISHDLGLWYQGAYRYVRKYDLWTILRGARTRALAPPRWLVRTLSVIEGGRMEAIEKLYTAAAGMSVEEIAAEVEASTHAGSVDAVQLAEAIAIGAETMAAPEG